jgi:hypothetical protein
MNVIDDLKLFVSLDLMMLGIDNVICEDQKQCV